MPHCDAPDGTRIHYEIRGDRGPWVVMLQGLCLSSRFWFDVPDDLAGDPEMAHRVLLVDNRGTGRSDRAKPPYRMAALASDVIAAMDAAGVDRAVVAGISFGGMIAQHVALRHPDRVTGLVLLATTPGLPHGRPPAVEVIRTFLRLPFAKGREASKHLVRLMIPDREVHRARELFARWPEAVKADPIERLTFLAHLSAVLGHSTGFRLRKIQCPTVVVGGAEDVLIPPHNARALAKLIPGAHLEILEGVGHAIPMLDRDVVRRAVRRLSA